MRVIVMMIPSDASHSKASSNITPASTAATRSVPAAFRLRIKEKGELIDRIHDTAIKRGFSKEEVKLLDDAMLNSKSVTASTIDKFSETIKDEFSKALQTKKGESGFGDPNEKLNSLDKILADLKVYKFKESQIGPEILIKDKDEYGLLQARYNVGEPIPNYVLELDVHTAHPMNMPAYLDVRLARKIAESIVFVNQQGNNTELFIGPTEDMRKYYATKGYKEVGLLGTKSSNRFYYFENPKDPNDAKVVITGILNSSRLNHVLLQLKFAGLSMNKVVIRGTFEEALKTSLIEFRNQLKGLSVPPELTFIGNRTQILIVLAERLYPTEMATLEGKSHDEKEKLAEELLSAHKLKTVDIGGGSFKFSYMTVLDADGQEKGVLALRMPNGSLAYEATKLLLEHGAQTVVMIGAGGSMDSTAGLGSYHKVNASSYTDQTLYIPPDNQLELKVPKLKVKEDRKNVTVDSPLVENKEWMRSVAEKDISSVDVETFHIFKAFNEALEDNPDLKIFSGLFISDVLGEHPLEEKINVENAWKGLPLLLNSAFDNLGIPDLRKKIIQNK